MTAKPPITILLVILFPLSSLSQVTNEVRFARQVSRDRLLQYVRDLVSFGNRLGGTRSGDRSAKYVAENMRSFGLAVETTLEPERLTYTHESWHLDIEEPKSHRRLFKHEWPSGFSPTTAMRKIPLVFVGSEDSISAIIGSVAVVTPRIITEEIYQEFVDAGASCILSYVPNLAGSYQDWSFITELPMSKDNPIPVFNISVRNGEKLRQLLVSGKKAMIRYSLRSSIMMGRPKTVMATLSGGTDDYYLVCAHGDSDSGGPGADDNASGVSGVMELARVLNMMVADKTLSKPKKTIKFIVWGSEYYSSEEYVKRHSETLENVLGVLNYDEIGAGKTRNCLYFEGNDIPVNENLLRTLQAVGEEYVGKRSFWHEATTNPAQGGTDSYVFLRDYLDKLVVPAVDIPSVTIYTAAWNVPKAFPQTEGWMSKAWKGHPDSVNIDYSPYYHSSMDVPATTTEKEPFNMEWAVKAVGIALLRLAW